ncbi:MAG: nuclear transport factor 2 family protein [Solirubrobacterales bacterium]
MSVENLEIVRTALDAYNRGDVAEALRLLAPDAEMDWSRAEGPYRGVYSSDQAQRFIEDYTAAFESVRLETGELIHAGENVLVSLTFHVRGREGLEATANTLLVWTIRDGEVARVCMYQERDEALQAAGLSE